MFPNGDADLLIKKQSHALLFGRPSTIYNDRWPLLWISVLRIMLDHHSLYVPASDICLVDGIRQPVQVGDDINASIVKCPEIRVRL